MRLRFLYAVTLFRHSRHTSAFYSEAVYSCPNRFNLDGIDNDWVRASCVREWIAELRNLHVFYHKPGGYAWKYRDVRLGLQSLLQKLPLFRSDDLKDGPNYLLEIRARTHFWIGDWYRKAFATTGHSVPAMESLYHRYQCAKFSKFATPSNETDAEKITKYQIVLFRSAILEMIKTLRLSRRWMKFWLSGKAIPPMFSEREKIIKNLKKWNDEICNGTADQGPLEELISTFQWELDCLAASLKAESSGTHEPPGNMAKVTVPLLGFIPKGKDNPFSPEKVGKDDTAWRDSFRELLKVDGGSNLQKILDDYYDETIDAKKLGHQLRRLEQEWLTTKAMDRAEVYKQVDSMSEFAYLHVKRAKMERHAGGNTEKLHRRWVQATAICYHAIGLCKHMHPEMQEEAIRLYCKLHTLYGLALAHLGRFFEAQRHINEATALLSKSTAGLSPTELAIIRLRKAEIFLVEGEVLKNTFEITEKLCPKYKFKKRHKDASKLVENFIAILQKCKSSHPLVKQAIQELVRAYGEGEVGQDECLRFVRQLGRMHVAALDNAWSALESVEKLFAGQSHSALWWGRFLALKLRVYGARVKGVEECEPQVKGSRFEYLAFRRRIDHREEVVRLFNRGLLVSPNDSYRKIRMVDYFLKAYRAVSEALDNDSGTTGDFLNISDDTQEQIEAAMEPLPADLKKGHLLQQYYKEVKKKIDEDLENFSGGD